MRQMLCALSACLLLAALNPAVADTESAVTKANRGAYAIALKCFVAYGINSGSYQKAGEKAKAVAMERQARASFDAVVKLGGRLGYSNARIDQDFGVAQGSELPKMWSDGNYFAEVLGTCQQVGL